ncbi:GDSL-type esterase/lipase family protein [Cyanobium sp. FGCU-52]|nr:GDSL-type esterase/lipase family protein [Cyanobium sp. FGCU52]
MSTSSAARSLRVMPMGDSITAGDQVPGGYRAPLRDRITGQGWSVDFVGSQRQPGDTSSDQDHWGRPGWGITDTDAVIDGRRYVSLQANEGPQGARRPGLWADLEAAISPRYFSTSPGVDNLLLLMMGTNDVLHQVVERRDGARPAGDRGNNGRGEQQNRIGEATIDRLKAFLNRVDRLAGRAELKLKVVLGTIPRFNNYWNASRLKDPISSVMQQEAVEVNQWIRERSGAMALRNITITPVDQRAAVGSSLIDGLHPDATGYRRMADTWWEGIQDALA